MFPGCLDTDWDLAKCLRSGSTSCSGAEGPCGVCVPSVKSVHQQDAGQYWCEVELHGQTLSSNSAWITVEGGTLNWAFLHLQSDLLSSPLRQGSLTSSRNRRMCPCSLAFPSTSPVLPLVLPGLWRCCGGSVGSRWENRDHLQLFSRSQVREPTAVPVKRLKNSAQHTDGTTSHTHTHTQSVCV